MNSNENANHKEIGQFKKFTIVYLIIIVFSTFLNDLSAQEKSCTVSILNRTARTTGSGRWILWNIPSNFGQIRARATCIENGLTISGQSDLFTVPTNGIVSIPISLGEVNPIPLFLTITSPSTILNSVGGTAQLTVTASYSDSTTTEVTDQSSGTNYTISNSSVATVSPDGVITAVASGTAIISASNEGALGLIQIQVILTGDTDGDGIPDDLEIASGLNPNNPVDGEEDPDDDGLTNKQELVDFGTNFQNPDTDGDGLTDGEEVSPGADGFITNPVVADTDGDGIRDGLEVATGTDPTDPNSFNLAAAMQSLEVTPEYSVLVFNSLVGEASRQLTVTGHLLDGSSIDLTSASRGTNYNSSNENICNFGGADGLVFAGNIGGTCTITSTNSGFSDTATLHVNSFQPRTISFIDIPGTANNVDVNGNFAYVAAGAAGLQVVDITNRTVPSIVASADTPGSANDVQVFGDYAYVADGGSGIRVFNISGSSPSFAGTLDTSGTAEDIAILGNFAYVADGTAGLKIIDILNPSAPLLRGTVNTPGNSQGVDITSDGSIAVIADGTAGIYLIDVTNPNAPSILGSVDTGDAREAVISGDYVYVADVASSLTIVDVSVPTNPVVLGSTPNNPGGLLRDVSFDGRFALGADFFFTSTGIPISDVSEPAAPVVRHYLQFGVISDEDGTGIDIDNGYVYLTVSTSPNSTNQRLYIGQYLQIQDQGGVAPSVNITTPVTGSSVNEGSPFLITVQSSDDTEVAGLQVLVNGQIVAESNWPVAQTQNFSYTSVGNVDLLSIQARALDFGNNVTYSEIVEVQVIGDQQPPSVSIVAPADGTTVAGGSQITVVAQASDNTAVTSVSFLMDGNVIFVDTASPYEYTFNAPLGEDSITLTATAIDPRGNIGTSSPVNVFISCSTTIIGRVVTRQTQPVNAANVYLVGQPTIKAVTDSLGGFSISGNIGCSPFVKVIASGLVSGQAMSGNSAMIPIVPEGTTDVGDVIIDPLGAALYPGPEFPVGDLPHYVAVGDLNNDGKEDIVTTNFASDNISILLGNGDGLFLPEQRYDTGSIPTNLLVADFNGDSAQDVITANVGSGDISVLIGNNDGTFDPEQRFLADNGSWGLASGDLDEDGNVDLVTANLADSVSVLIGNGNGTFQSPQLYSVGDDPYSVAIADFNTDNHLDIVAANRGCRGQPDPCVSSNDISVLLGNGDGTFQSEQRFTVGDGPFSVALGDLNEDNLIDIVTANEVSNDVSVLIGSGSGSFNPQQLYQVGQAPDFVLIDDLNSDGNADVISINSASSDVSVLTGDGTGSLQTEQRYPGAFDEGGAATADFNGDSKRDLVVTSFLGNSVVVLFGGTPLLESQVLVSTGLEPNSISVADVDSDNIPDLIFDLFGLGEISIHRGNGDGTFNELTTFDVGNDGTVATLINANVDSGNTADLVWGDLATGEIVVRLGNGDGTFGTEVRSAVGAGPFDVVAAELNGDSNLDIVTGNFFTSNSVSVLLGNGDGTFQSPILYSAGNSPSTVVVGDINNDLSTDIIVSNIDSNDVSIFINNGDGTFQAEQRISVGTTPAEVVVADFNDDGNVDLATTNVGSVDISVRLGNGDGTFGPIRNFASEDMVGSLRAMDLNGDTFIDLIAGGESNRFFMLFLGNGDGTFSPGQRYATGNTPASTAIHDLNGDGKLDIVTTNFFSDNLSVLLHR